MGRDALVYAGHLLARLASLVFVLVAVWVSTFVGLSRYDNQCFVWYDVHTTHKTDLV